MKKSKFLTLNERDIIKGFIVAIVTAWLTTLYNLLNTWVALGNEQWKAVLIAWVCWGIAYILKNLTENSAWEFGKEI
jgi:hypothetical protein